MRAAGGSDMVVGCDDEHLFQVHDLQLIISLVTDRPHLVGVLGRILSFRSCHFTLLQWDVDGTLKSKVPIACLGEGHVKSCAQDPHKPSVVAVAKGFRHPYYALLSTSYYEYETV